MFLWLDACVSLPAKLTGKDRHINAIALFTGAHFTPSYKLLCKVLETNQQSKRSSLISFCGGGGDDLRGSVAIKTNRSKTVS